MEAKGIILLVLCAVIIGGLILLHIRSKGRK